MTTSPFSPTDRLTELLADRAVRPLDIHERAELDGLLISTPSRIEDEFDLAAAAADLALFGASSEPLPDHIRASVSALGVEWTNSHAKAPVLRLAESSSPAQRPRPRFTAWTGWIAAAAAIVLAFAGWWNRPATPATPAAGLAELRSGANDLRTMAWAPGPTEAPDSLSGEVIWSPSRQKGYMVFRGMRPNNPAKEQYQLWIFDKDRDERYPVDGGVFDITGPGECIVEIHPSVEVNEATLFAVTIERPGGVVVSDRSRLPALAQPKRAG